MSDEWIDRFENISEYARSLARSINSPVCVRATGDGWEIVDLKEIEREIIASGLEDAQEYEEERLKNDPEHQELLRKLAMSSGLGPLTDID